MSQFTEEELNLSINSKMSELRQIVGDDKEASSNSLFAYQHSFPQHFHRHPHDVNYKPSFPQHYQRHAHDVNYRNLTIPPNLNAIQKGSYVPWSSFHGAQNKENYAPTCMNEQLGNFPGNDKDFNQFNFDSKLLRLFAKLYTYLSEIHIKRRRIENAVYSLESPIADKMYHPENCMSVKRHFDYTIECVTLEFGLLEKVLKCVNKKVDGKLATSVKIFFYLFQCMNMALEAFRKSSAHLDKIQFKFNTKGLGSIQSQLCADIHALISTIELIGINLCILEHKLFTKTKTTESKYVRNTNVYIGA